MSKDIEDSIMEMMVTDRDNSLLTESQRRFLIDRDQFSSGSWPTKRQRIRDRARDGLLDLALLNSLESSISEEDIGMILGNIEDGQKRRLVARKAIQSLSMICMEAGIDLEAELEEALYMAHSALEEDRIIADVDVSIDVDRRRVVDPMEAWEQFKNGDRTVFDSYVWMLRRQSILNGEVPDLTPIPDYEEMPKELEQPIENLFSRLQEIEEPE